MAERPPDEREIAGSNPARRTATVAKWFKAQGCGPCIVGSIPTGRPGREDMWRLAFLLFAILCLAGCCPKGRICLSAKNGCLVTCLEGAMAHFGSGAKAHCKCDGKTVELWQEP